MSFATNGMRQGTPRLQAVASSDQAMAFSNCNIIDYKQGLHFGMDVAPTLPTVSGDMDSRYSLNLDRTGHTVDMQITQARQQPGYQTDCESCSVDESISEMAGKISREMVQNKSASRNSEQQFAQQIASLKREMTSMRSQLTASQTHTNSQLAASHTQLKSQLAASASRTNQPAATSSNSKHASDMSGVKMGLEHHTDVLQRTQHSILRLDTEIQSLKSNAQEHRAANQNFDAGLQHHTKVLQSMKTSISEMDVGLVNHTGAIRTLKSADTRGDHTAKLQTMQRQLVGMLHSSGQTKTLVSLQTELATLRSQLASVSEKQRQTGALPSTVTRAIPAMQSQISQLQAQMQTKQPTERPMPRQQTSDKLASLMAKYNR